VRLVDQDLAQWWPLICKWVSIKLLTNPSCSIQF
jgi:hypothetical protein